MIIMRSFDHGLVSVFFVYSLCAFDMGHVIESVKEPLCSRFPYEEALLEKIVRMEFTVEKMVNIIKETKSEVGNELEKLRSERELAVREREEFGTKIKEERADFEVKVGKIENDATKKMADFVSETESKLAIIEKGVNDNLEHTESVITRMSEDFQDLRNGTIQDIIAKTNRPTVLFRANNVADRTPNKNQKLVFQTILENQGDGYNKDTGIFTAPHDGVYLFAVQFCTNRNNDFNFAFVEDGEVKLRAELDNKDFSCGTAVYLTELKKNSGIWIKSMVNYGSTPLSSEDSYRTNNFSGILINSKSDIVY